MSTPHVLAVARGDAPADVVFTNGRIVNVFTAEVEEVEVAVAEGYITGLGEGYEGQRVVDLEARYLLPGFLDAHVHIESSLATPPEFARAVVPRGTTTVVADPHEIANVHGLEGIRYLLESSEGLPLSVFVMAPSCVPATPMGTAGAALDASALASLLDHPRILGLGEVMNFPGVIHGDPEILAKLDTFRGRVVDGHAPGVRGRALNAYVAASPASDHECTTAAEALEKLRRGVWVFLREATNARNLLDLLPALRPEFYRRVAFCTDDRQPPDLLDEGGIDAVVRAAVRWGIPPLEAIRMATLNPAEYFRLHDRGAIAPGRRADLVLVKDLEGLEVEAVYSAGKLVARDGKALPWGISSRPSPPPPAMNIPWNRVGFGIPAGDGRVRAIRIVPDQIVTRAEETWPLVRGGEVVADPERDLLKMAVLERYTGSGRVGLGLVAGMGLREGAMAGTVAHDHHNLVVIGVDDTSMMTAARHVAASRGGLAVARGQEILAALALPVGGLMSEASILEIRTGLEAVIAAARGLGSSLHDPFMAMSFLALEVIPSLKLTDQGLVDVERFERVDLWV